MGISTKETFLASLFDSGTDRGSRTHDRHFFYLWMLNFEQTNARRRTRHICVITNSMTHHIQILDDGDGPTPPRLRQELRNDRILHLLLLHYHQMCPQFSLKCIEKTNLTRP